MSVNQQVDIGLFNIYKLYHQQYFQLLEIFI